MEKRYEEMRQKFLNGEISKEDWYRYCTTVLHIILDDPEIRKVFERLKSV